VCMTTCTGRDDKNEIKGAIPTPAFMLHSIKETPEAFNYVILSMTAMMANESRGRFLEKLYASRTLISHPIFSVYYTNNIHHSLTSDV